MIKRIGVIGAGQMGSGIAHVCALKGFDIRLIGCRPGATSTRASRRSAGTWTARSAAA